ncbi:MAG: M29 family metallopeptidase [Candidatus Krumholzibacteriia bacterium]
MSGTLDGPELARLVRRVFAPGPQDDALAIMVDLPDERLPDNPAWRQRRSLAAGWAAALAAEKSAAGLDRVSLVWYRNAGGNNADLPAACVPARPGDALPDTAAALAGRPELPFAELFATHRLILAPTELSATAPLKVAARAARFRAATMPGFTPAMVPALRLDYGEVNRRVTRLKELLDAAADAEIVLRVGATRHRLRLDLRHRQGHASGGLIHEPGTAGNLPSGEAYIVPYEGERPGDPSRTAGELPVQFDREIVRYEIAGNRAVAVLSRGPHSDAERELIAREPAYANLAELGLGVLADFGLVPVDSLLLDEKLGLHLAFGRSDHFGGQVGPAAFSGPGAVVHIDRVYLPQTQPLIAVETVTLGERVLMREGRYTDIF